MKKAIITGANGFIGRNLIAQLIKQNVFVIAVDMEGCNNNIPDSELVFFAGTDGSNIPALKEKIPHRDIDVMYHIAWAGVGSNRDDFTLQMKNVDWTLQYMNLAKELGCKRFVGAGSIMEDEVYDATQTNDIRPGLGYIYGAAKMAAHSITKMYANEIGLEHVWAILTNAYGVGEFSPRLINSTLRKIINNEPLQFTSGTQNYDFVYITDVARAFYFIGKNGKPFNKYLIGSGNAKPLKEFILEIKDAVAKEKEFIFGDIPFTGTNLPLSVYDCKNTAEDTGFTPEISFREGIIKTMDWIKTVR